MDFNEYQKLARRTAIYPSKGSNLYYPALGLCGEAGEVAEVVKKVYRDGEGRLDDDRCTNLEKELGDALWYIANTACEAGLSLDTIACKNIDKLSDRQNRNVLHGSGDDR